MCPPPNDPGVMAAGGKTRRPTPKAPGSSPVPTHVQNIDWDLFFKTKSKTKTPFLPRQHLSTDAGNARLWTQHLARRPRRTPASFCALSGAQVCLARRLDCFQKGHRSLLFLPRSPPLSSGLPSAGGRQLSVTTCGFYSGSGPGLLTHWASWERREVSASRKEPSAKDGGPNPSFSVLWRG